MKGKTEINLRVEAVEAGAFRLHATGGDGLTPGDCVEVAVRPEKIRLAIDPPAQPNVVPGQIENVVYLGAVTFYYLRLAGDQRLVVMEQNQTFRPPGAGHAIGAAVYAGWETDSALALRQG